ncbi:MAG: FAD-dependent oxidoreductase [Desulfarculaceae bacterium]|jgi:Pyruvate/2-oxoacid:ferredoxin oxidoreductase delta subunit
MSNKVIIRSPQELPPVPCSMGGMDWNPTGLWRYLTPEPRDKAAPCASACPAGNPIPKIMALLVSGKKDAALELLLEANPLPGVTGRLCFHPCQPSCLRKKVDRALPIQGLERWVANQTSSKLKPPRAKGPKVAVVGAGPVGLTCAYLLGRQGSKVTLYDPGKKAGGFLRGAKGLPASVLNNELRRLVRVSGIKLETGADCGPGQVCLGASPLALVIVDDYAHEDGTAQAKAIEAAWPHEGLAPGKTAVLHPEANPRFKGFKPSQVAMAVGMGQETACRALAMLRGEKYAEPPKSEPVSKGAIKPERFAPEKPLRKSPARLDEKRAHYEAARCMSCGRCNLCQQCVLFCPDACIALAESNHAVKVDLEHCKGCGICAEECPRGVISMEAAT